MVHSRTTMEWGDLKILLAVAKRRSTRAAAKNLGVNHATVSRRIRGLETVLGVRLFERLPSGLTLTAEGEDVLRTAEQVEEEIGGLERRLLGRDTRLSGEVRLTLPDLLSTHLLMPDFAEFNATYPDIELKLVVSYEVLSLALREADVALRITRTRPAEGLTGRKLITLALAAYASVDYLRTHDLEEGAGSARWIGWDGLAPFPDWVKQSAYPNLPAWGRFNDPLVQVAAAKAGLGLARLPCFVGDLDPDLIRVSKPELVWPVWLLTHPDLRKTARIRVLLDFIPSAIAKHRKLLEGRAQVRKG